MDDQNKNLILATALSFGVILIWFVLFPPEDQAPQPDPQAISTEGPAVVGDTPLVAPGTGTGGAVVRDEATLTDADVGRVAIETAELTGSISLQGGRIDDLSLTQYRETLDEGSPLVRLLSPVGAEAPYYALYGWAPGGGLDPAQVPGPDTIWRVDGNDTLTEDAPVRLTWSNGAGLSFARTVSVDENFLFTIEQEVTNSGADPVRLAPYGIVARHGEPDTVNFFILHEGVVRMTDGILEEMDYDDLPDLDPDARGPAATEAVVENGWIGFTDKYWMTTLMPAPGSAFTSTARYVPGRDVYQAEAIFPTMTVAAGETATSTAALFAGAKEWEALRSYQDELGFDRFLDSIDWGWFFFLTKPIFWLLHELNIIIGNMGWAIIGLTLIIKLVLLPLAYKSYVSMARMKELQPEMEKLKERAGDDRQALQQGMMKLYRDNKVNPASGCLPILLQIPIFFSLYKVIFVTIELRHAPWLGWIRDLSAPDPSSILNLFGLLPWGTIPQDNILSIISLGVLPILLGISMWMQQKLNPAPTDPTQKMIFAWLPWVFMFMLGNFASGLVLYWIANNTITFIQQYAIMRSQGYKPDLLGNITGKLKRTPEAEAPKVAGAVAAVEEAKSDGIEAEVADGDDAPTEAGLDNRATPRTPNRPRPNRPNKARKKRNR
ncbi:MAG: membrane protein insertase YidC [Paracoccaceae bacterium]